MIEIIVPKIGSAYLAVFILFSLIWILYLYLNNAAVVDIGWGLGFIIISLIYILLGEGFNQKNILYFIIISAWGLRIMFYLFKRFLHEKVEDKRYQKLRLEWKTHIPVKFFFFFQFQALLEIVLSLPFLFVSMDSTPGLTYMHILGFLITLLALLGETIADEQLFNFKKDPGNSGKTCNTGLWYYSRHPNYFFEWLVWVGLAVFAMGVPYGWLSLISPVIMYILLIYFSGVPLAEEQSLKSRGEDYRIYQEMTSMFFLLPKRKNINVS